jgi:predicted AAA+ superfamily ATPase
LLTVVHEIIEQKKNIKFVLSGSSPRKLKRTGADLLGGRALHREMHPFMASEMGEEFNLAEALKNGMLPIVFRDPAPQEVLQTYISLYLKEEIQTEGLIRNFSSFSRFLEAISFSHASLLNVTNVARECEVKRGTVQNYIQILEELLLSFQLPVFTNRAKRELVQHPKFYIFDAGVFTALRPRGILNVPTEIQGLALEGLVAQHLRAWNDYSSEKHQLSFWRTRAGLEVDFIVYGPQGFWAIEVKNSNKIHPADLKSLEAFAEDYPMARTLLLYRGDLRFKEGSIECIPCDEFFRQLRPNQLIWP